MPPGQANLTRRAKSMSPEAEPHPPFDAWNSPWPQTRTAVTALVDDFADRLVRYAFRQVGNLQDAEDVVQEVFVRAFGEQTKRSGISAAGPYLYRSVGNACTDLLRKRNRAAVYCEEIEHRGGFRADQRPGRGCSGSREYAPCRGLTPGTAHRAGRNGSPARLRRIAAQRDRPSGRMLDQHGQFAIALCLPETPQPRGCREGVRPWTAESAKSF